MSQPDTSRPLKRSHRCGYENGTRPGSQREELLSPESTPRSSWKETFPQGGRNKPSCLSAPHSPLHFVRALCPISLPETPALQEISPVLPIPQTSGQLDGWTDVKVPMNMIQLQLSLSLSSSPVLPLPRGYHPAHPGPTSPLSCPQHPTRLMPAPQISLLLHSLRSATADGSVTASRAYTTGVHGDH